MTSLPSLRLKKTQTRPRSHSRRAWGSDADPGVSPSSAPPALVPSPESFHECHPGTPGLRDQLSSKPGRGPGKQSCVPSPRVGLSFHKRSHSSPTLRSPRHGRVHCAWPGGHKDPHQPCCRASEAAGRSRSAGTGCLWPSLGHHPQADSRSCSHLPCCLWCMQSSFHDGLSPKLPCFLRGPPHPTPWCSSLVPPAINHASPSPGGSLLSPGQH